MLEVHGFFERRLLTSTEKMQETGPLVYRPCPRRLNRLTICECRSKDGTSPQLFKDPEFWTGLGLYLRHHARQSGALQHGITKRDLIDISQSLGQEPPTLYHYFSHGDT